MNSNAFPIVIAGLFLAGVPQLSAQMPDESPAPKVLMVIREQIKEGREAAHVKAEEAWPRIFRKGNVTTYYVGMTPESGPSEAWFLEPYDSFGGMEKARAEINKSWRADLDAAEVVDSELRTGSRTMLAVFRGELSYHAAEAMASMPKSRHMEVTLLRIKYGHDADLVQTAKLLIDGYEKSNSDQPVLTYMVTSGGPAGMYLIFSPMDSLARMDGVTARAAAARQVIGERNRQRLDALASDTVQSSENLLFAFEPRMSYVSKEFAAADPEFWIPKAREAPKLPAKHKTAGN